MAGDPGSVRGPDGRPARLSPAAPPGRWSELAPPPPPPAQRSGLRGPGGRTPGAGRGRGGGCAAGAARAPGRQRSGRRAALSCDSHGADLGAAAKPSPARPPPPRDGSAPKATVLRGAGPGRAHRPEPPAPPPWEAPPPRAQAQVVPRAKRPRPLNLRGRPTSPTGRANRVPQLQRVGGAWQGRGGHQLLWRAPLCSIPRRPPAPEPPCCPKTPALLAPPIPSGSPRSFLAEFLSPDAGHSFSLSLPVRAGSCPSSPPLRPPKQEGGRMGAHLFMNAGVSS